MPLPGPFHVSHLADYDVCAINDPDVGPSAVVCDVEHTFFHFGLCGRKFVLCLFGQCPRRSLHHVIAGTTQEKCGVVHLSLQADGKVAFEETLVFGECR